MGNLWTRRGKKSALWRGIGVGAGLGAGLMYLLDPDRGRRRRALVRDKAIHFAHVTERTVEGRSRDLKNRAQGVAEQIRSLLRRGNGRENRSDQAASTSRKPSESSSAAFETSKAKKSGPRSS